MAGPTDSGARDRLRRWLDLPVAMAPSVTHDGSGVLFLSTIPGIPSAWQLDLPRGEPRPLIGGPERVAGVFASPTGPAAILARDHGGDERWQLELVDGRGTNPPHRLLTGSPETIHTPGGWDRDGRTFYFAANRRDPRFFDVHAMDVTSGRTRSLVEEDAWLHVFAAGRGKVVVGRLNTFLDVDLFVIGDGERVHLNPHDGELSVHAATFGHDGVYAAANPSREHTAVVRYRPGRSGHEFVAEYPGDVDLLRASDDGHRLAVAVNRDGWSDVHLLDLDTLEDRSLTSGPRGVVYAFSWAPDGASFVYEVSDPEGRDLYHRFVETGKERRLTRPPDGVPSPVPSPRLGRCTASDGVRIPFWDHRPSTVSLRGTIVDVHGGPEGQARPEFIRPLAFLVNEGWRVLRPNVRGSSGYGRTFLHMDDVRKRMDSVRDLKEFVDSVRRDPGGGTAKVGVMGGSYGGFMVLASISTYPELFDAAVDIVGISNFVTFLEKTGPWRRRHREVEYGSLERDREFLESISPIRHVERIRTPLLVIHGANDPRVPLHEAEQIVARLTELHRPVELLTFPDEGHGVVRRPNQEVAFTRVVEFFAEHLGGAPPAS